MTKIKEKKKKEDVSKTVSQEPTGQQSVADLSIGDLKNLATIIDVASTRGAFRANEMATVGVMFNKLQSFLSKVAPQETKPENVPATAEAKK